jgi:hypothetical protein
MCERRENLPQKARIGPIGFFLRNAPLCIGVFGAGIAAVPWALELFILQQLAQAWGDVPVGVINSIDARFEFHLAGISVSSTAYKFAFGAIGTATILGSIFLALRSRARSAP